MLIDVHTHLGRWGSRKEPDMTEDELLGRMDELGIDKAVILPLGMTPECFMLPFDTEDVLAVHRRHPDRIIPFCNLDPRSGHSPEADYMWVFEEWRDAGCKGLGELTANLPFDDPMCLNLYRQCGRVGFPVLFHLAVQVAYGLYGVADEMGLPRLEKTLRECPQTVFIGHAMAFWAEIASNVEEETRGGYPPGPVAGPGRTPQLLKQCPNLYGDLSAGSGFNAISRDPEFGYRFLEDCQDKLLFGTDICHVNQEVEIVPWLNDAVAGGKISKTCFEKISHLNAEKLGIM
jgi:predicted TIM-barrel fold metal-dependent hydrolase